MLLAGLFATFLFLAMLVADWFQFTRLTAGASAYGFAISRGEEQLPVMSSTTLFDLFDSNGVLRLHHGIARFFREERRILLRPRAHRFRTAWPINGSIEITLDAQGMRLAWVKRVPWSSAVLTLVWFAIVGLGTLAFIVAFAVNGGIANVSGIIMAVGIACIGLLVFAFGLVTVSLAYRLENHRLGEAYQELRAALLREEAGAAPLKEFPIADTGARNT